jgi:hypothetical protein
VPCLPAMLSEGQLVLSTAASVFGVHGQLFAPPTAFDGQLTGGVGVPCCFRCTLQVLAQAAVSGGACNQW